MFRKQVCSLAGGRKALLVSRRQGLDEHRTRIIRLSLATLMGLLSAAVLLSGTDCPAVTSVTVSPTTYTFGDVATTVIVEANTAAAGNELVFDVYADVDGDKNLDPEDWRFMSFEIPDGQAPPLGNAAFWHDADGTKNSSVKATLIANGAWAASGHFIIKVTDKNASTAKASLSVVEDTSYPCVVTGEVRLGASPAKGPIVEGRDMATDTLLFRAVAGLDGKFALRVKSPGQCGVAAMGLGAVSKRGEGSGQIINVVAGSNPLPQPLLLFTGNRKISGKVFRADTSAGFRGVLVHANAEGLTALAATGDDGAYNLAVVDGDWERVSAMEEQISRFGYIRAAVPPVTVSGSDVPGIDLRCVRATALITGTVKDADTLRGLQGYGILAEIVSPPEGATALSYTGADGSYALGVVAGEWEVGFEEETLYYKGYVRPYARLVTAPGSGTVPGIDFLLEKAGTITGHVYEDDGVTPIGGVGVQARDFQTGDFAAHTETLPDGSYTLPVASGTYRVSARVEGWADQYYNKVSSWDQASPVTVAAPGATSGIDFVLQPGATITGHVYEEDGVTPLEGAEVEAYDFGTGNWVADAWTREDGSYTLYVPWGTYRVSVTWVEGWLDQYYNKVSSSDQASPVTVTAAGETSGIDFVLQRGATITGHAYQAGGTTPIAGGCVRAVDAAGSVVAWGDIDDSGFYSITVPSGSYRVCADAGSRWFLQYYNNADDFSKAAVITLVAPEQKSGINFALWPRPFIMESLRKSAAQPGALEVQWSWLSGMQYLIYWAGDMSATTLWREVPDADKDIVKEGLYSGSMTWTDKGTSPGMNGKLPGDPSVLRRFYRVKEEPE